jgi:glycosyltransferase involved in cell wall biosynthesis
LQPLRRIAFVGNSLPRRCGIATFTSDLHKAVAASRNSIESAIVAMTDHDRTYAYPADVLLQVHDDKPVDYARAAATLNAGKYQIACLQHEFGIFGGDAGGHVIRLLSKLDMPIVTTLHTVLAEPKPVQREVLEHIVDLSSRVVVMAQHARELLRRVYGVSAEKIEVIPHGVPDSVFSEPDASKAQLGFGNRSVILTFGLLSPNKGIEVMIDAMPAILRSRPDAIYVVLGATHPNLVHREGEAYRERLVARAHALQLEGHVVFLNQFVDQRTLLEFISMCDVYVTPYLNEAQMTSGTLAYSFGMGKAVVSTPYWHARELLAEGRGVLVPFGDAEAIGAEIAQLLIDDPRRNAMRQVAYASSRSMTWERTAERYLECFEKARSHQRFTLIASIDARAASDQSVTPPPMQLAHLLSMCDDTGLLQHAVHCVADRSHGYCVDDNARALLVACALNTQDEQRLPESLTGRFAAFLQHAWNADAGRFRNFMSFDRRWLDAIGSEDCHGRALWALGECSRNDVNLSRRQWAAALFRNALPAAEHVSSPRAWAFALLGLDAYCASVTDDASAVRIRAQLADRLLSLLATVETATWVWFEDSLAYDNARLCQALITTGVATGANKYVAAGLRTLRWLMSQQTAPTGYFRPVGSDSFGERRASPKYFDQQPLETTATISACLAAWQACGDPQWKNDAACAFAWFFGSNDLSTSLVDVDTGSCRDGLHPDRANENRGGESVVSYLLSLAEMRKLSRLGGNRSKPSPLRILRV